ncbi:unnamed protein product, partial [Amoebophrya sp. A25]
VKSKQAVPDASTATAVEKVLRKARSSTPGIVGRTLDAEDRKSKKKEKKAEDSKKTGDPEKKKSKPTKHKEGDPKSSSNVGRAPKEDGLETTSRDPSQVLCD